jgi:hypothetical protein
MNNRTYLLLTGFLFLIFAVAHLCRLILILPVRVDAWAVPVWVSWIPFAGGALLSIWAFRLARVTGGR